MRSTDSLTPISLNKSVPRLGQDSVGGATTPTYTAAEVLIG